MPWCDECSRFWNPNSMPADGTCPSCGAALGAAAGVGGAEATEYKAPWHFWVFVGAAVVYLSWRVIQMVGWLV